MAKARTRPAAHARLRWCRQVREYMLRSVQQLKLIRPAPIVDGKGK